MLAAVAPAKLNLCLHILGKRADGYHLLESLVAFTEFGDHVEVAEAQTLQLEVHGPFAAASGPNADNLVLRAARALAAHTGVHAGAHIRLQKNVPVGAGLGGGSGDAATALKLLNRLWGTALTDDMLAAMAAPLGADVPMCLLAKPCIARGIGQDLQPFAVPLSGHVVLVCPPVHVSTAAVYCVLDAAHEPPAMQWQALNAQNLWPALAHTRNHLQRAAISLAPEVAEVLLALETAPAQPAFVRMSGSGACCFAVCHEKSQAESLASSLRQAHPQWWVRPTAFLA